MFFKKKKVIEIKSPVYGVTHDLSNVPDEVFSQRLMGDGIAVEPESEIIVSPIDGTVEMIMEPTHHAMGLRHDRGLALLIHVGLETVALNGEHFEVLTSLNKKVKAGDPLLRFDREALIQKGYAVTVMLVVTEPSGCLISGNQDNVKVRETVDTLFRCTL